MGFSLVFRALRFKVPDPGVDNFDRPVGYMAAELRRKFDDKLIQTYLFGFSV